MSKQDDLVEKIYLKQEEMASDITEIKSDLSVHIYRTELAEENIELLREEIKPIKKHVTMVQGILQFLGFLSLLSGIIFGIIELL